MKIKKLLLKDLCARLPYGFIVHRYSDNVDIKINTVDDFSHFLEYSNDEEFKPYLRSMSSMTDEEREEWTDLFNKQLLELEKYSDEDAEEIAPQMFAMSHFSSINWLYSKHFNIILPKETFIEVTEENNPYKQ